MPEKILLKLQMAKSRVLVSKTLILLVLAIAFYFGVWINLKLLKIIAKTRFTISILTIITIAVLVVVELLLAERKLKTDTYDFYANRIEFRKKIYYFGNVRKVYFKRNLFDRILKTGTIVLAPVFNIKNVSAQNQIFFWVQKLIKRGKSSYY